MDALGTNGLIIIELSCSGKEQLTSLEQIKIFSLDSSPKTIALF